MKRLHQQRPFLESILKEANRFKRQDMLQHANADQINAVSELILNLLKRRIPLDPPTTAKLRRYKTVLREVGKRKNSLKRRKENLLTQKGSGFWQGLKEVYCRCLRK